MYLPELSCIRVLLNKDIYNKYINNIDIKYIKDNYKELGFIYEVLIELHTTTPSSVTLDELQAFFYLRYPTCDRATYSDLFSRMEHEEMSDDIAVVLLKDMSRRKTALQLSEQAYKVSQGSADVESLNELVEALNTEVDHQRTGPSLVSLDLEQLLNETYQHRGIRWRLNCLNVSLGSLRPGDFGFLFARPETGKTTFLASEVSNFLTQVDRPIIHINNEEQGAKVMMRYYQALFGVTLDKLQSNPAGYKKAFMERTKGLLQMYDSATISKREVEAIVKSENPSLVLYDQIDKIKGFTNDRDDLRLGAIYQWARELAKGSHAAIAVCQADGHAEGVRYLTMEHVANAKTSKQAEADWILGLGKTHDENEEFVRYLNISKNKLFGDPDSKPELKHGRFSVLIEPQIARYKDIISYD